VLILTHNSHDARIWLPSPSGRRVAVATRGVGGEGEPRRSRMHETHRAQRAHHIDRLWQQHPKFSEHRRMRHLCPPSPASPFRGAWGRPGGGSSACLTNHIGDRSDQGHNSPLPDCTRNRTRYRDVPARRWFQTGLAVSRSGIHQDHVNLTPRLRSRSVTAWRHLINMLDLPPEADGHNPSETGGEQRCSAGELCC